MNKQRNHFQLKDKDNSPERTNNETDQSNRPRVQTWGNKNTEGIKKDYQ